MRDEFPIGRCEYPYVFFFHLSWITNPTNLNLSGRLEMPDAKS
jgi:hypothetical protein